MNAELSQVGQSDPDSALLRISSQVTLGCFKLTIKMTNMLSKTI